MLEGVSVVITTVKRIDELDRAIDSVLKQSYKKLEIIVVVDGGDKDTLHFLQKYQFIKIISNVPSVGGAESRNLGIRAATMPWVALLDDDDEWLEDKIQLQLSSLQEFGPVNNIVSFTSLFTYVKNQSHQYILPREKYISGQNVGDYLFTLNKGRWNGWIQTSTLMALRETFLNIPFDPTLPKHQDWDWIMKVYDKGIPIIHVNEPLSIYHKQTGIGKSVSQKALWNFSEKWINNHKQGISEKAYSDFIISVVNNGISKDRGLSLSNKLREITYRFKKLSAKNILSLSSVRFTLQYVYNIIR